MSGNFLIGYRRLPTVKPLLTVVALAAFALLAAGCTTAEPSATVAVETAAPTTAAAPAVTSSSTTTSTAPPQPVIAGEWREIAPTGLGRRAGHTAVWTGGEVIVFGGGAGSMTGSNRGARYDPETDAWRPTADAPLQGRSWHTAIWTGDEMLVWGGRFPGLYNDGAAYDPLTDSWRAITDSPLGGRSGHGAVWTGTEMIVIGGHTSLGNNFYAADAAAYDPARNEWRSMPDSGLPSRSNPSVVWTGEEVIVWGGVNGEQLWQSDGAAYDPVTNTWRALPPSPLDGREGAVAVWTGAEVVIAGGVTNSDRFRVGAAAYDPVTDTWRDLDGPDETGWTLGGWTGEVLWWVDGLAVWDGTWRRLPSFEPMPDFGAAAVWTGRDIVVVGGELFQDTPSNVAAALRLDDIDRLDEIVPEPLPPLAGTVEERLMAPIDAVVPLGPRVGGSVPESDASFVLQQYLEEATGELAYDEFVPLPTDDGSRNVWVTLGDGDTHVLLGAHYDSVEGSLGVDDNLSGVSVLIELAARLARDPVDGLTVTIVLFGAEEVLPGYSRNNHHFGSRLMAERLATEDALPDYMVSVDMVGIGSRLMAVTYEATDATTAQLLAAAAEEVGIGIARLSRGDISDHEAFARAGVPSAFMWRPDNPAWHTPADDDVDLELLVEDLTVLEAFLHLVASR